MDAQLPSDGQPAAHLEIRDLDALKTMSDPLRARIVDLLRQRPATAKELAADLQQSPKSLYYHLGLLERNKLIRVVETRVVSGITEKRYRATAYLFQYEDLRLDQDGSPEQGLDVMATSLYAITNQELRASIRDGLVLPGGPGVPCERTLHTDWTLLQLFPEQVEALEAKLCAVLNEYAHADDTPAPEGTQTYRLLLTMFPTATRGVPPRPAPADSGERSPS